MRCRFTYKLLFHNSFIAVNSNIGLTIDVILNYQALLVFQISTLVND